MRRWPVAERWPRAVVFDLDGTLVESVGDIADALNASLAGAGLAEFAESDVRLMVGGGAKVLIERALGRLGRDGDAETGDRLLRDFLVAYRAAPARRTVGFAGAEEVLQSLGASGRRLAICTNKPADITREVLAALGYARYFASIVGSAPDLPPKPHAAMLQKALGELGAQTADAVMVGDSLTDLETARAAGVKVVLLSHGYSARPVHELGADAVARDLAAVPAALAGLAPR